MREHDDGRGKRLPGWLLSSALAQVPRSRFERDLWLSPRDKPFKGSRLDAVRVLVERGNALLAELPGGEPWTIALREGYVVLRNDHQEHYHWNGGDPVLVEFGA